MLVTTAVPVATTEVEGTTWQAGTWLWIIYGLGIGMLLLRNLLEVSKIHHSLACSRRYSLKGVPVYQSEDVGGALFLLSLDIHKSDAIFG